MIGYIIAFLCFLSALAWKSNYMQIIREYCFQKSLAVYHFYINRKVRNMQRSRELACYKRVFMSDDNGGAFVIIDGQKFYLVAMKAKPTRGTPIGDNFYTTEKKDAIVEVVDDSF